MTVAGRRIPVITIGIGFYTYGIIRDVFLSVACLRDLFEARGAARVASLPGCATV